MAGVSANFYRKDNIDAKLVTNIPFTETTTPGTYEMGSFTVPTTDTKCLIGIFAREPISDKVYSGVGFTFMNTAISDNYIPIGQPPAYAKLYWNATDSKLMLDLKDEQGNALTGVVLTVNYTKLQA